ncbi:MULTISPECIES: hypothetical protein [Halobacterium]|uniref:Uncharacterized protein n=1 Tax=Halobacterium salinarum (strain ATCC 33171 / DSM 3754 / JCM 8978 / NBRC 102687 / NCIMB 764 / 91-R6) TaxID=2597657 RepID=A0A4D6GSM2_HALS9|nr:MULTISPECIES: hypothetical protein [Halobacterium]MCF2206721.1 hypothetical protein [Halobacterium salinarum]MCF2239921.1 hypothetical protein [Halobacterium salinarum]MDL0122219.1 hypothetical protein [Halobacterium salinarum]MDL0125526.1 hypothetical protein [Halobacterium salinarum]MDL0136368.1 hypothetical protein [Halobacterium salinarum]
MPSGLVALVLGALVSVTVLSFGAYVGALRALDVYFSDQDSVFLSDDAGPRE